MSTKTVSASLATYQERRRELRQGLTHAAPTLPTPVDLYADRGGCAHCRYGLVGALRTDGPGPLYLLFVYLAQAKQIEFCTCAAGKRMRGFLREKWRQIQNGGDYVPPGMEQSIKDWVAQGDV